MPRLAVAFFCSGFGALLCQVVWQRMLGIFAGSDTVSAALVVGAFLAGLGLGSIIGAKVADRLSPYQALIGFALAEAGVAAFALLSKAFLYDVLATDLAGVVDDPFVIFALCFAGLVLPTTLMGASLPLLARAVATSLDTVAERIGTLYGLNTLGAGLGALLGGWLLVGNLGYVGALVLAAGLDLVAALLALTLLPGLRSAPVAAAVGAQVTTMRQGEPFGSLRMWCLLVFLSGYVIVALEIVWVRLMGVVGQYHAYLFPTVLGTFLLADGLGMAVAARMVRRLEDPRPAFFVTQAAGFVLAAVLILALYWALPLWPLNTLVSVDSWRLWHGGLATSVILSVIVVGPPSFLIGMTFPFVQRAVQQDLASVGARVGWVQLANILGNAAGSIGTGLVTFHLFGTAGTLQFLAVLSLLLMLGWLWREGRGRRPELGLAAACAALLLVLPSNARFWSRIHAEQPNHGTAWAEDRSGIAFYRYEASGTAEPSGPFFIQGFSQGRIPFFGMHMFLGAVGPLVHPDPKRVLLIGIGSGGTPWAAGVVPATERIRAIELIGPVLTALRDLAGRFPDGPVAAMLRDPRWQMEYGDARRALSRGTEQYDIIQADAIMPETSHSGLLYSEEFLQQVRRRLAPGGIYVQWGPSQRVVETFSAVFPHVVMLMPASVLIGSDRPIPYDPAELARRFADPAVAAHLARGSREVRDFRPFFERPALVWDPATPRAAPSITDVFPRDEFYMNNPVLGTQPLRTPADVVARAGQR
ncbi:fused MFS/spermidine synthase [Falsiroseomonas sp. CW058]|uniref:fused MFS/spermidine synthase n=1 Tax=Falsiroseomonas sp. CW058 TaxID=3388664 RepID=UPI003D31B588